MGFTFGKEEKLKSKKQIEQLFAEGKIVKDFPILMKFLKTDANDFPIKVAFSVPKKNFKLAVDRNRIKRLLRETYRLNKHMLLNNVADKYVVMFIYTDKKEWSYTELEEKMIAVLNKFIKKQKTAL